MASASDDKAVERFPQLEKLSSNLVVNLEAPVKRIHDGPDVSSFLTSLAYRDIMTFILQLNRAMMPRKTGVRGVVHEWTLNSSDIPISDAVHRLQLLIASLVSFIAEAPPDTGPRRFGNVSFRRWHKLLEERADSLLEESLPVELHPAIPEVKAYLVGSFGSPQRLDYGTGHELSFLAFLGCLWKLNFFPLSESGVEERAIVVGVFERYLELCRQLIKGYTLEPAGSHGVWGLDDNSFLPYLYGSAQLCPAISEDEEPPDHGSLLNAPEPASVTQQNLVEKEKVRNMYFSAIAFIFEVKRGPFGEHSPILYDISGVRDGWGRINKGMIKMYNGEVLSKFPVVQHFPFGSLFKWERDPDAKEPVTTTHTASQPLRNPLDSNPAAQTARPGVIPQSGTMTAAPWATARPMGPPVGMVNGVTRAPWATQTPADPRRPPPPGPRVGRASAPSPIARPPAPTPRSMLRDPSIAEQEEES